MNGEQDNCIVHGTRYKPGEQDELLLLLSIDICIHTAHALFPKGQQRHLRYSSETSKFYQKYLATRNTADLTGGKPIAVWSQQRRALDFRISRQCRPKQSFQTPKWWLDMVWQCFKSTLRILMMILHSDSRLNKFLLRRKYWFRNEK
jgi:hypothetical protein